MDINDLMLLLHQYHIFTPELAPWFLSISTEVPYDNCSLVGPKLPEQLQKNVNKQSAFFFIHESGLSLWWSSEQFSKGCENVPSSGNFPVLIYLPSVNKLNKAVKCTEASKVKVLVMDSSDSQGCWFKYAISKASTKKRQMQCSQEFNIYLYNVVKFMYMSMQDWEPEVQAWHLYSQSVNTWATS